MPTPYKAVVAGIVAFGASAILLNLSAWVSEPFLMAGFLGLIAAGVVATGGLRPS